MSQTHPQHQEKEARGEAEASVLPSDPVEVPGNVQPAVHNAEAEVGSLVTRDGNTEEIAHLETGDGNGSGGGEAGDDREGYEVDEEAEMEDMTEEDEAAGEEGEEDGVLVTSLGVDAGH